MMPGKKCKKCGGTMKAGIKVCPNCKKNQKRK